ncbi:hypothetical protein [Aureispira anguillae]|uniref:Uncharacterized protein n=1 Tax=Aureispira anguillae TaxID=2864201 RepID=A0A915YKU7_9BACT|nr:hypothetical protein [Aureispira anguillae]BDS14948.1 hypothetical protein AsAng_0057300 [Aureispira anguillae]
MINMIYLLLVLYIAGFGWWLRSIDSPNILGLPRTFIFFIFISKIIVGLIYGLIHHTYFQGGDTFIYLQESTRIGSTFLSYPSYYINSIFGGNPPIPDTAVFIYPSSVFFWKDLGTYTLVHVHAILYPFTLGHYELHIFFIALIGLFASLNFYKVFGQILELPKWVLIVCCFFLPSLSFWTAGLHKDAYVYFGLSLFLVGLLELQQPTPSRKTFFKLGTALLIIGFSRHYLLALLLPAIIAYLITLNYTRRIGLTYLVVYSCSIGLAILFTKSIFGVELFEILSSKQAAFLAEIGGSSIQNAEPFAPTIWGVISMIPMALINVLGRPFLWECKDFLQVLASLEILSFLGLILCSLSMKKKHIKPPNVLIHFIIAYAISNLFLVGLLVSNIGTIARYRAIALGILSALLMHILDFYQLSLKHKPSNTPSYQPRTDPKTISPPLPKTKQNQSLH